MGTGIITPQYLLLLPLRRAAYATRLSCALFETVVSNMLSLVDGRALSTTVHTE